jgi:hypothetical protein
MYKLYFYDLGFTKIPSYTIFENSFLRIELRIGLHLKIKTIIDTIYSQLKTHHFTKINFGIPLNIKYGFHRYKTIKDVFIDYGVSTTEIDVFLEILGRYNESISLSTRLSDLNNQQYRYVKLRCLTIKAVNIIIPTSGMYIGSLLITYDLIKEGLNRGCTIIEISYPPFDINDSLSNYITNNPNVLILD